MTLQIKKGENNVAASCTAQDVENYLKAHPEFFQENPELLIDLKVPHPSGNAVSLIERQVALLRQENKLLNIKIKDLIDVARINERLIDKLHTLSIALIETQSLDEFIDVLKFRIEKDFSASAVSVRIFRNSLQNPVDRDEIILREENGLNNFEKFLSHEKPVCGRFNQQQLGFLFGENTENVKSMALFPLVNGEASGMVAVASDDPEHFKAGMSTVFLVSLRDIVSAVLKRYLKS